MGWNKFRFGGWASEKFRGWGGEKLGVKGLGSRARKGLDEGQDLPGPRRRSVGFWGVGLGEIGGRGGCQFKSRGGVGVSLSLGFRGGVGIVEGMGKREVQG